MTGFEPIAGTIGAVAFADQLFSRCFWLYGKYQITQKFGENSVEYSIQYASEVWRFENIINHSIFNLEDDILDDDRVQLKPSLRNRLYQWAMHLQTCDGLIQECEANLPQQLNVTSNMNRQLLAATQERLSSSPSQIRQLESSTLNTTSASQGSSPNPPSVSDISSDRHSNRSKRNLDKFKRIFVRRGRREMHDVSLNNEQPGPEITTHASASTKETPVSSPTAESSLHGDFQGLDIREAAREVQERSSLTARGLWIVKRERFLDILKQLKDHGDFFTSAIQIKQTSQTEVRLLRSEKLSQLHQRYEGAGDRLNRLVQALAQLQGGQQATLKVMMHQDPFQWQTALSESLGDTAEASGFRPHSAAFCMRITHASFGPAPRPNPNLDSEAQLHSDSDARYPVFDVPDLRKLATGPISGPRIDDVQRLVEPANTAEVGSWASFLGHMGESIHIILDSTSHAAEKTLARALVDEEEQQELKNSSHANFRARLGLTVASSMLCRLHSEGPRELEATHLCYYPGLDENGHQLALSASRINPFMPMRSHNASRLATSSAEVFSEGARNADVGTLMIQKLGVMLYEIGTWSRVVGGRLPDNVRSVRVRKEALAIISPLYRDVTGACLDYQRAASIEKWMLERVVEPLLRVVDRLDRVNLLQ